LLAQNDEIGSIFKKIYVYNFTYRKIRK